MSAGFRGRKRALSMLMALAAIACLSARAESGKPDLDIPADSRTVDLLKRVQARSGKLMPVQRFPQGSRDALTFADSGKVTAFDREYLQAWLPGSRRERFEWRNASGDRSLFLSPLFETEYRQAIGDSDGVSALGGLGLVAYGKLAPGLAYYTRGLVYTEKTDRAQFGHQFGPESGETHTVEKGEGDSLLSDRTFHRFENYLLLDLPWIRIKAGRDRVRLGPGYFTSLLANADTPPYYLLEGRVPFSDWLDVDTYLLKMADTDHDIRKYANIHRFGFRPHPAVELGFQDIVIYQDRDPDPVYLLPLAPLSLSEATNGGRDNAAMAFDFTVAPIPGLSVWGELFIDDLLGPAAFFDDFWENRWASLFGLQAVSPWDGFDADLVAEYSHVEPWTYNGRKAQTSFRHFGAPSASRLGPDSRTIDIRAAYRPWKTLEWSEHWEHWEKGGVPGSILGTIHDDAKHGQTKSFLEASRKEIAVSHRLDGWFRSNAKFGATWRQVLSGASADMFALELSLNL